MGLLFAAIVWAAHLDSSAQRDYALAEVEAAFIGAGLLRLHAPLFLPVPNPVEASARKPIARPIFSFPWALRANAAKLVSSAQEEAPWL